MRILDRFRVWNGRVSFACCLIAALSFQPAASTAQAPAGLEFAEFRRAGLIMSAIGVTRRGTPIDCLISKDDLDYGTPKVRILLISGFDGSRRPVDAATAALRWFYTSTEARPMRQEFAVSAVPVVNPDGLAAGREDGANESGGNPTRGYPPPGDAYHSPTDPEAAYLWRWIGMHAPDLVVEVRSGDRLGWIVPDQDNGLLRNAAEHLDPVDTIEPGDQLVSQLVKHAPSETGGVAALRVTVREPNENFLPVLLAALKSSEFRGPSPARREIQKRLDRTPLEVARQLSRHYGHDLNQVVYIPALALMARIRLGELIDDDEHLEDVERIVGPYVRGEKPAKPTSGSALAGHLIFCELARVTTGERRKRYIELARGAADLAFDEDGNPRPVMPFHLEMSDALFMGGPILARMGRLTDDDRYFDACGRHLRFMRGLVFRDDGLVRHSPLDEAAWGRGNGFPALGLAMCLTDLPQNHPARTDLVDMFRKHMAALARHQDPTGCWHQVIDRPGSYRELTSTCMIAFAMMRGLRLEILDREEYEPIIDRAWQAILTRTPSNGRLVDVCTGTGKQQNLRAYYDRKAILGPDPRGGAMAFIAAVERATTGAE